MDQTYYYEDNYPLQPMDYSAIGNEFHDEDVFNPGFPFDHVFPFGNSNWSDQLHNSSAAYYVGHGDDEEVAEEPYHYVEPAVLIFICFVGLIGNGLVILVIVRQVTMRKVTYLYLTNLAVVNLFYLLTTVPFSAISYTITNWPFGAAACKLHGYVTSVCLAVSVFTLMITGLDRYFAVLHPVTSRKWRTERKAMVVILVIWVVSFLIMIPRLLLYDIQIYFSTSPYMLCSRLTALQTVRRMDSTLMLVTMYILPQLVLTFCHLKIGLLLWQNRRPGAESQDVSLLALRERRRIAKVVFAITVAFGIGWLPMHVTSMYEDFSITGSAFIFDNRAILVLAFSFSANAINPILYCLLSKHFRKHFKRAVTCWKPDTNNAVHHMRSILDLQRHHEDIVVIDLEKDMDHKNMNNDDDIHENGEEGTDGSAMAAARDAEEQNENSSSINCYVHTGNSYVQVSPSYHDSGHGSGDDEKRQSGKISLLFKKTMVVSTASKSQYPTPHDV